MAANDLLRSIDAEEHFCNCDLLDDVTMLDDVTRYTIHPWIASLYVDCVAWDIDDGCKSNPGRLRCPSKAAVAAFDNAVRRGELLWADSYVKA